VLLKLTTYLLKTWLRDITRGQNTEKTARSTLLGSSRLGHDLPRFLCQGLLDLVIVCERTSTVRALGSVQRSTIGEFFLAALTCFHLAVDSAGLVSEQAGRARI
jgi:hypothetical protein